MQTLVAAEEVAGIDLVLDIIQTGVIAVGYDGVAAALELIKIVHHLTAKEGITILKRRLVDNDLGSLGLDAFHHTLDGTLTEIVGV